jgi:polyhydroxyalkanoate synthesis regulator phasin
MPKYFTKNIRINKPQDIRRLLAKVINILLQDGEMSTDKAKTIATLSNTTLKSMELGELSDRLEQIENELKISRRT